jgi:hypothetical protein
MPSARLADREPAGREPPQAAGAELAHGDVHAQPLQRAEGLPETLE